MKKTTSILLAAAVSFTALSETIYVGVSDFGFSPSFVEIHPGDTIVWFNDDEFSAHGIRSEEGLFAPAILFDNGDAVGFTFDDLGSWGITDDLAGSSQTVSVVPATTPTFDLQSITKLDNGSYQMRIVGGASGQNAILFASSTLTNWTAISTNVFDSSGVLDVVDPNAPKFSKRFYKAQLSN